MERQRGLMERSNISFGHMLKLIDYKEELATIVVSFLDKKHPLLSNLNHKGVISIFIKSYTSEVSIMVTNEIILDIYKHLDNNAEVETVIDFEENEQLKPYFSLTLIET